MDVVTAPDQPQRYRYRVAELQESHLPGWPEDYRAMNKISLEAWGRGVAEAIRHKKTILKIQIGSPYPLRSYCLGLANYTGAAVYLFYWLFPCLAPAEQAQAVAVLVVKTELGAADGEFDDVRLDVLTEEDLSGENASEIKEAAAAIGDS